MGEQTDKAASCAAGSLLPSASADGWMIVQQMKGTEVHRGRGFASKSFKPSAEADGKREPTATRQTSFVSSLINQHLQVQIQEATGIYRNNFT